MEVKNDRVEWIRLGGRKGRCMEKNERGWGG